MEIEEPALSFAEAADVDHTSCFDSHPRQRGPMGDRRDNKLAGILEAYESTIKQMIDTRREQQSVLTVKSLRVLESPHGLQWLAIKVDRIVNDRDAAKLQITMLLPKRWRPPRSRLPIVCTGRRICALKLMLPSMPPCRGESVNELMVGV